MQTVDLQRLRAAQRIGVVFSGGSSRCAFQVGALETLAELDVRPVLCIGVSGGVWNAAATAAGTSHRLRYYWRAFCRMPHVDITNLLRERSPYIFNELHRRTFSRYVGANRLRRPGALPLLVGVTRLRDLQPVVLSAADFDDPLPLLLASNYLPPFYTQPPKIDGGRYADGAFTDNVPYPAAFAAGCDAVVLLHQRGESEGKLFKSPREPEHTIPAPWRAKTVVIRPRHRLPVGFTERRWEALSPIVELGRLRAREVLLGEYHPETDAVRAEGRAPSRVVIDALRRLPRAGGRW